VIIVLGQFLGERMPKVLQTLSKLLPNGSSPGGESLVGTWKLVSSKRTNLSTNQTVDTLGANPKGFITYGTDGRMMVIETSGDRPKPQDVESLSDQQRLELFSSLLAYAGTYEFDGKTIKHHIDVSWNEVWSGSIQERKVEKDGDRLIFRTIPAPSPFDGSMGYATLIWEKVS
jgi:hypothetical protein